MILDDPKKHLTDQELYTHIKFFEYMIDKKDIDNDNEQSFRFRDVSIGSDDKWYIFNRIFKTTQLLEAKVYVEGELLRKTMTES